MPDYTTVNPNFWTGETGRKLREAGPEAQLVALYLLSNSHRNPLGLYYLPKMLISHETALSDQGASKGLQRGIQAGFCAWEGVSEVVWVYKMAFYQIGPELTVTDKRVKWVNDLYKGLPNNQFLWAFWKDYGEKYHIERPRGFEGAWEGHRSPTEANINININNNISNTLVQKPKPSTKDFETFWTAYPKKRKKADALKAWSKQNGNRPPIETLLAKLTELKSSFDWTKEGGQFIPLPASWLNSGGWDDQVKVDISRQPKVPTFFNQENT